MACNNTSLSTDLPKIKQQPLWISSFVLSSLIIVFHTWITFGFFKFIYDGVRRRRDADGSSCGRIMKSAMTVLIFPYVRYAATQAMLWISTRENDSASCNRVRVVSLIAYVIAILSVYIFLWLRQRAFYGHPLLLQALGKWSNRFSWGVLVMNIGSAFGGSMWVLVRAITAKYDHLKSGPTGCVVHAGMSWHSFLYGSFLIVLQCVLLGIILYPLCFHYKNQKNFEQRSTPDQQKVPEGSIETVCGATSAPKHERSSTPMKIGGTKEASKSENVVANSGLKILHKLIWKTTLLAAVCIVSDFGAMTLDGFAFPVDIPQYFVYSIYDTSLLLDITGIVASFPQWKTIFLPWISEEHLPTN